MRLPGFDSKPQKVSGFFLIWILIALLFVLKIPSAFRKIYAEDGMSLQQSLENPFPKELAEPVAGYLDLLLRGTGAFVSLFPLGHASFVFFAVNTFLLAILWTAVYISSTSLFKDRKWKFLAATGLVLMPIGNFESIANAANLHFYFMSACVVILLARPTNDLQAIFLCVVIFFSATSVPLMLLTFPLLFLGARRPRLGKRRWQNQGIVAAWILGNLVQFIYISVVTPGQRKSQSINSIFEVLYLYLDRVVGTTFMPFWGSVSGSTKSPFPHLVGDSEYLLVRGIFSTLILLLFAFSICRFCSFTKSQLLICVTIFFVGVSHWFLIGLTFNPEPRYAIFSSYCLLISVLYGIQNYAKRRRWVDYLVITCIFLTWIGSWAPSALRTEGPTWKSEFNKARSYCLGGANKAYLTTAPINKVWQVRIDCNEILKSY